MFRMVKRLRMFKLMLVQHQRLKNVSCTMLASAGFVKKSMANVLSLSGVANEHGITLDAED